MTYRDAVAALVAAGKREIELTEEKSRLLRGLGVSGRIRVVVDGDGEPPSGIPRLEAEISALQKPVVIYCDKDGHPPFVQGYDAVPEFRSRSGPNGPIDVRKVLKRPEVV